jgi:HAD superfamily hydrolase (TIGR01484 family)
MARLSALGADEVGRLRGLLFDLDDTLLDHGKLSEAAYSALFRLKESGFELYAVTGRPLGWVRLLSRLFPIDGGVAENGGMLIGAGGLTLDGVPADERARRTTRLTALVAEVKRAFPSLEPPDDAGERLTDYTFDIGERNSVAPDVIAAVTAFARERGATVHVSSVHLHVGFDAVDKASGVVRLLKRLQNIDPTAALARYAFIGDSENDAACFAAFHTTIGVQNLKGRPSLRPRFITDAPRGRGFAELAAHLVTQRRRV